MPHELHGDHLGSLGHCLEDVVPPHDVDARGVILCHVLKHWRWFLQKVLPTAVLHLILREHVVLTGDAHVCGVLQELWSASYSSV